jgi:hypothetical protein
MCGVGCLVVATRNSEGWQSKSARKRRPEQKKVNSVFLHFNIIKALDYVNNTYLSVTHNCSALLTNFPEIPHLRTIKTTIIIIQFLFICVLTQQLKGQLHSIKERNRHTQSTNQGNV